MKVEVVERDYVAADGSRHTMEIHASLIEDHNGHVVGLRSAKLDVGAQTRRNRTEEGKRSSGGGEPR